MKRGKRRTHYVAAAGVTSFDCYREDKDAWISSGFSTPEPKKSTNVVRVDCPYCLRKLNELTFRKLSKAGEL